MEQNSKQEREQVIQEFNTTIKSLVDDFRSGYNNQAKEYELRLHSMQQKITDLTTGKATPKSSPVIPQKLSFSDAKVAQQKPTSVVNKYPSLRSSLPPQQQEPSPGRELHPETTPLSVPKKSALKKVIIQEPEPVASGQEQKEKVVSSATRKSVVTKAQMEQPSNKVIVLQPNTKKVQKVEQVTQGIKASSPLVNSRDETAILIHQLSTLRAELEAKAKREDELSRINFQLQERLELLDVR
jgi:hypothetical protein